jgi:hypothetical protein
MMYSLNCPIQPPSTIKRKQIPELVPVDPDPLLVRIPAFDVSEVAQCDFVLPQRSLGWY